MYVYELTAYEYSDYTTWLLVHDEKFSEKKFKAIVAEADSKIKTEWIHSNYVSDLLVCYVSSMVLRVLNLLVVGLEVLKSQRRYDS